MCVAILKGKEADETTGTIDLLTLGDSYSGRTFQIFAI